MIGVLVVFISINLNHYLYLEGVHFKSAKKKKGMGVGFVSFKNAAELKTAEEVREGRTPVNIDVDDSNASISEVMLIIQVSSGGFDDAVVTGEFKSLAEAFAEGATANSPSLPLTALVVQDHQGISNVAPAYAPLRQLPISKPGSKYVIEQ